MKGLVSHEEFHETSIWMADYICLNTQCEKYDMPVGQVEQDTELDAGEDQFRENI